MLDFLPFLGIAGVLLAGETFFTSQKESLGMPLERDAARGFLLKAVRMNGRDIRCVIYVPPVYNPEKPTPTIVFLNGMGECGTDGLKQIAQGLGPAVMLDSEKWPFIIVFPQKQNAKDDWEDEEAMLMEILDAAHRVYNIDESRLYLTGISQGGHGTWAIAAKHPDMFAAIAPICGWGTEAMAQKLVNVPVWVFHGEDDEAVTVKASRDMVERLESAGGSCRLTTYPDVGHNSWDKAYREEGLHDWFLAHHKQPERV